MLWAVLIAALFQVQSEGTISGTIRTEAGAGAAEVRIAIVDPGDRSLVRIAQTDNTGRYRLDEIPPGRYYVVAGRIDGPTYYPGTLAVEEGTLVSVNPRANLTGIDFVMQEFSRRPITVLQQAPSAADWTIPLRVSVEGGGPFPLFSPAGQLLVRLTHVLDTARGKPTPLNNFGVTVPPSSEDYRIAIENLPDGFSVKSVTYGTTNVTPTGTFRVAPIKITSATVVNGGRAAAANVTDPPLTITLQRSVDQAAPADNTGITVRGKLLWTAPTTIPAGRGGALRLVPTGPLSIYLSDMPGTLYSDRTFEFHGVPAGQHALLSRDGPGAGRPFGALIVVGASNVDGLEIVEVPVLPIDINASATPSAFQGTLVPLASIRARIVDAATRQSIAGGTARLKGFAAPGYSQQEAIVPMTNGSEVVIRGLLPGTYDLEIQAVGYPSFLQRVTVGSENVELEIAVKH